MTQDLHYISVQACRAILGLEKAVPLTAGRMAEELCITFYPRTRQTPLLEYFTGRLSGAFESAKVKVIPYEEALKSHHRKERVREGITLFTAGQGKKGQLAADHISSLYNNPVVGIFEGPCPVHEHSSLQAKLDAIVSVLAWQMIHTAIFVDGDSVTVCTMNGAVIEFEQGVVHPEQVVATLIPKLTAQVVPPRASDITYRFGTLDLSSPEFVPYIEDFLACGRIWARNEAMVSHTSVESLAYRSSFYKRIVSAYLDRRSGMSYGFFAWQLPAEFEPALTLEHAQSRFGNADWRTQPLQEFWGTTYVHAHFCGTDYVVPVPEVQVLSTRSGCEKFNLNPKTDIVRMGLAKGKVYFETPRGIESSSDCKPSYDTLTILAHSVANALVASILERCDSRAPFPRRLRRRGLSLTHWHGYPDEGDLPQGYVLHGAENPSVSCSTPQSALYALLGKFRALRASRERGETYLGDVHLEPHHGTNIVGVLTLAEIAEWHDALTQEARDPLISVAY